jgi:23S rRNA pseudoU1915 N3-methylase RlmH
MSFLDFFKSNPTQVDPLQEVQYNLLNPDEAEAIAETRQINGALVNQRFNSAMSRHGVDGKGRAMATNAITEATLGCSTSELYNETGGTKGKRHTLPLSAQEALSVGEIAATHELNGMEPVEGDQQQKNREVQQACYEAAAKARPLFPWWQ